MRSSPVVLLGTAAAFAVPVGGALALRDGIPMLPDALWVCGLAAAALCGARWRTAGATIIALLGAGLVVLVHGVAPAFFRVATPHLPMAILAGAFAASSIGAGLLGAWLDERRRVGRHLESLTDSLTGLPNRRHAEMFLAAEFAVAELGRPIAILLLDVDRFTAFAASSGEAAANGVLRAIGTVLRRNTRTANLSAHWGQDRFICLASGSRDEGAFEFALKLEHQLRQSSGVVSMPSVSIGIASYSQRMRDRTDLVRAAEEALQIAKRDGGDRIRVYGRSLDEIERMQAESRVAHGLQSGPSASSASSVSTRDPVSGSQRSAFVFATDTSLRRKAAELFERRGLRVSEGSRASESMRPLNTEFDVFVVDLTREEPGVRDLVREVRRRFPATRIVGIPGYDGHGINASSLAVHVDGHLLRSHGAWTLQPSLDELFRERDRLRDTAFRALQLSDEVRVKEREARRAQQESEAKLQSVVQSIREVLFRMDRSGAWISLSPAWSSVTGFAAESSLGRPWLEFFHEDDREALERDFHALTGTERPYLRREARILTRSGGHRWVEVRAQLAHDRLGNVMSASGTLTDITERRRIEEALNRSEEYFRALIENAAEIIAVLDAEGRPRYTSPAVRRVLGITSTDEEALPSLEAIVHPDDLPAVRAALLTAEGPGASATLEMRARHANGAWRHLAVSIRNLLHINAVRGYVVNAHDVTDSREAERALRESEEALYRARKMDAIGVLAGGIAHDFNNLLTAIEGHANVAIGALPEDHPIRSDLSRILESSTRAATLTRQLLAFGRRQVLRPRVIELNVFISDMQKMLVRLVGDSVQLRTELAASPDRVRADPLQIERALLNLAVNARESMPQGGVLTISTRSVYLDGDEARKGNVDPGGHVMITVADTGRGIARHILPHVFDPFFTTKPQAVGVGLGLSTVYGIIRQSGGHITADSTPARDDGGTGGTTFSILLPTTRTMDDADALVKATEGIQPGATIALVEDEPAVRDLAARVLRGRGYSVIPAEDGRHALDVLARYPNRIDMLLTDVVMPGMSGRDLADHIGVMRPGLKILFMSGYSAEAVEAHGVLARGATFLEKPFSPDVLLRKVRDVLDATQEPEARA